MNKFFLAVALLLIFAIPFSLLCYLVLKITKSVGYRVLGVLVSGFISFIIMGNVAGYINERNDYSAAVRAGFTTVEEHKKAKSLGLNTKELFEKYKEEQEKVLAEKQKIAMEENKKRMEEKKRREEYEKQMENKRKEEKMQARQLADENCKQDLKCLAEKNFGSATVYCGTYIEKLAKYDFKWTVEGWFEQKFSHYKWKNKENGVITYIGDKAMFQNGFGAWQAHIYECDFDTKSEKVLDVRARPGRL